MGPKKKAGTFFIYHAKIPVHKMMHKKLCSSKTKSKLFSFKSSGNNKELTVQKHSKNSVANKSSV